MRQGHRAADGGGLGNQINAIFTVHASPVHHDVMAAKPSVWAIDASSIHWSDHDTGVAITHQHVAGDGLQATTAGA
jgi:hypothetical protein